MIREKCLTCPLWDYHSDRCSGFVCMHDKVHDKMIPVETVDKKTLTQEDINDIIKETVIVVMSMFDKTTIVVAKLPNGFIIVESSSCVSPENYDVALGKKICMKRIEDKIWELEGYKLHTK